MATKQRNILCHLFGACVGIAITVALIMLLDRGAVLTLDPSESRIDPDPARHGTQVAIRWTATEHRNCAGRVIPRVIDSSGRIFEYAALPAVYHDLMMKSPRSFEKTLTLPIGMMPGPARYQAVVIRWCNVMQKYFWPMVDPPFPIPFEVER